VGEDIGEGRGDPWSEAIEERRVEFRAKVEGVGWGLVSHRRVRP
jgi:hypothetical protein